MIGEVAQLPTAKSRLPLRQSRFFIRSLSLAVGLLLLTAAGLKLYGLRVSPVPAVGTFASPRFGIAIAAWEIVLGFWLIFRFNAFAWVAATLTFSTFAVVSGYFGVIGVSKCGCLGFVEVSPWIAFLADGLAIAALIIMRPYFCQPLGNSRSFSGIAKSIGLVIAGVVVVLILIIAVFGSIDKAVASLRGERLSVSASYIDLGDVAIGDKFSTSVNVTNYGDTMTRLIGGSSDCSCTATQNLPLTIPPGETVTVVINMNIPVVGNGQMTRSVWIMTDQPEQPRLILSIGCRVKNTSYQ